LAKRARNIATKHMMRRRRTYARRLAVLMAVATTVTGCADGGPGFWAKVDIQNACSEPLYALPVETSTDLPPSAPDPRRLVGPGGTVRNDVGYLLPLREELYLALAAVGSEEYQTPIMYRREGWGGEARRINGVKFLVELVD